MYGAYYGYQCAGGTPNKTACMYGGVTLHDNNGLNQREKSTINLWLDGKQNTVPLETVKTNKKNVTVQELDLQARRYLQEKYNLYNSDVFDGKVQGSKSCFILLQNLRLITIYLVLKDSIQIHY